MEQTKSDNKRTLNNIRCDWGIAYDDFVKAEEECRVAEIQLRRLQTALSTAQDKEAALFAELDANRAPIVKRSTGEAPLEAHGCQGA